MPFPPNTRQTVKLYSDSLDYAPPPGFASRWAPGTGPRRTNFSHNFHGPLHSSAVKTVRRRATLGDGDSLGDGILDAVGTIFSPAVSAVVAPAEQQLANLKSAISAILVLSAIAAGTGVLGLMRGR